MDLDDKVRQLLDLEVTFKPDDGVGYNVLIKRRVKVEDYSDYLYGQRMGIEITVRPEDGLCDSGFKASYPRSATSAAKLEKLKSFIDGIKGHEAYIIYTLKSRGGRFSVLQMIAPIGATQLYVKGDEMGAVLMPYQIENPVK